MANHSHIKTKRFLNQERIAELINELNQTKFSSTLQTTWTTLDTGYPFWSITIPLTDGPSAPVQLWLNSQRYLESRHAPGDFCWWIELSIINAIANRYKGIIRDDGISETEKPAISASGQNCPNNMD